MEKPYHIDPQRLTFQKVRGLCLNARKRGNESKLPDQDDETERFLNVSVARLDWRGFDRIENLEVLTNLKDLYLQYNQISVIENLEFHPKLEYLALGHNNIKKLENLTHLSKLRYLDLSHNKLERIMVDELPTSLTIIDLRGNPVQPFEYEKQLLEALPNLNMLNGKKIGVEYYTEKSQQPTKQATTITKSPDTEEQPNQKFLHVNQNQEEENEDKNETTHCVKDVQENSPAGLEKRLLELSLEHSNAILERLDKIRSNIIKRSHNRAMKDRDLFDERTAHTQENTAVKLEQQTQPLEDINMHLDAEETKCA